LCYVFDRIKKLLQQEPAFDQADKDFLNQADGILDGEVEVVMVS
jgi:hypothetical protein